MMRIKFSASGTKLRGKFGVEQDKFSIIETPKGNITGTSSANIKDQVITTTTSGGFSNDFQIQRQPGFINSDGIFSSLNSAIATVNSITGQVTYVSNGNVTINYNSPTSKYSFSRIMNNTGLTTSKATGWVVGSLAKHMDDAVKTLISGKTAGKNTQSIYLNANFNGVTPSGTVNPNLFCRKGPDGTTNLNIECITFSKVVSNNYAFPAVLISPHHVIVADHVQGSGELIFEKDGTFYRTTIVSGAYINPANLLRANGYNTDCKVWYVDPPITAIQPAKVLPSNWRSYLPNNNNYDFGIACITRTNNPANTTLYPNDLSLNDNTPHFRVQNMMRFAAPNKGNIEFQSPNYSPLYPSTLRSWSAEIYGGDSGSPSFTIINNQLCLIGMQYTAGTDGLFYSDYITEIEAAMNAVRKPGDVTTYLLTKFSVGELSGFATY